MSGHGGAAYSSYTPSGVRREECHGGAAEVASGKQGAVSTRTTSGKNREALNIDDDNEECQIEWAHKTPPAISKTSPSRHRRSINNGACATTDEVISISGGSTEEGDLSSENEEGLARDRNSHDDGNSRHDDGELSGSDVKDVSA